MNILQSQNKNTSSIYLHKFIFGYRGIASFWIKYIERCKSVKQSKIQTIELPTHTCLFQDLFCGPPYKWKWNSSKIFKWKSHPNLH